MLLSLDQLKTDYISNGKQRISRQKRLIRDEERFYAGLGYDNPYQNTVKCATWSCPVRGYASSHYSDGEVSYYDNDRLAYQRRLPQRRATNSNVKSVADMILGHQAGAGPQNKTQAKTRHAPSHKLHSRAGTESKGSSIDLGHAQSTSNMKWVRDYPTRSSSFNNGHNRYKIQSKLRDGNLFRDPNKNAATSATMIHEYQRSCHGISPPVVIQQLPKPDCSNLLRRKKSMRSTECNNLMEKISTRTKKNHGSCMRVEGRVGGKDRSNDITPVPTLNRDLSGSGKRKEPPPLSSTVTLPVTQIIPGSSTKERPGIFRRVFGSRNVSWIDNFHDHSPLHGSSASNETTDRPGFKSSPININHLTRQTSHSVLSHDPMPTLSKKSSSFFRRRKKSFSNGETTNSATLTPPPKPSLLQGPNSAKKNFPTPPISLRTVLHPCPPTRQTPATKHDSKDSWIESNQENSGIPLRSFSPAYDPAQTAMIRSVSCSDQGTINSLESSCNSAQQSTMNSRILVGGHEASGEERDASCLQGTSDIERDMFEIRSACKGAESGAAAIDGSYLVGTSLQYSQYGVYSEEDNFAWCCSLPLISRQNIAESALSIRKTHIARQQSEDWVKISQSKKSVSVDRDDHRIWLEPSSDEEEVGLSHFGTLDLGSSQIEHRRSDSTSTVYESIVSLPVELSEGEDDDLMPAVESQIIQSVPLVPKIGLACEDKPTEISIEEQEYAKQIYDGNEDLVPKDKAAAWLGEEDPARSRSLAAYMNLYNFTNINILAALRMLCGRLALRAESQQVDRILVAFSRRWCECNPFHGFKATDVVHTICYSLLLLNTDLHLADIEQKMTRSQFIKNAMPIIRRIVTDAAPEAFEPGRPTILPGKSSAFDQEMPKQDPKGERPSLDAEQSTWTSSTKNSVPRTDLDTKPLTHLDYEIPVDDSGPLVSSQFRGSMRTWEVQIEIVLKNFYNSIRSEHLPLFGSLKGKTTGLGPITTTAMNSSHLSFFGRTPSVLSHAHSDTQSNRSRATDTLRPGNRKRTKQNRSRPGLYPIGSGLGSSRTSLDDQTTVWSPVSSSSWSKYSLGKTQTSISVDSLGSSWPNGDYQQSIGFANALSQAIIREETVGSSATNLNEHDETCETPLLEDESLELHGAPWAKEGLVKHKHHLEALDKKAKERNWNEVFAVVEKGYLSLFSFTSKSMRQKSKGKVAHGVVGGGNWQENAESLGSFLLRQTIASALPSPGYSKTRPHVWALSLPTGAVHLFQVGTLDIVKEFVSTANYWSARMSNHPLVGGISNVEYGWSDAIIKGSLANSTMLDVTNIPQRPTTSSGRRSSFNGRTSIQEPMRASIDQALSGIVRNYLHGDKISVADWSPPTQNMRASSLGEQDQLKNLTVYVSGIEEELQKHNELRSPMLLAFTPRHLNAQKAMANWEKKSAYLLREIVKFRTYIDALQIAESSKDAIYAERENRKVEMELADQEDSE